MGLYLCIAHVDLEGSPRRMFLCDDVINEMLNVMMMILYDVGFIDEHDVGPN